MSVTQDGDKSGSVPHRMRWILRGPRPEKVPAIVGTACTFIGLVDIAAGRVPRFRTSRVHDLVEFLPGTLGPPVSGTLPQRRRPAAPPRPRTQAPQTTRLAGRRHPAAPRRRRPVHLPPLSPRRPLLPRPPRPPAPPPQGVRRPTRPPAADGGPSPTSSSWAPGSIGLGLIIVSAHPRQDHRRPRPHRPPHPRPPSASSAPKGPVSYSGSVSWTVGYSSAPWASSPPSPPSTSPSAPSTPVARLTEDDEARLRELLARHGGRDSLGHFALRRDKAVVFSPSGKAAVTYRVVSGVMLASGDPIGDVEAWPAPSNASWTKPKPSWTPRRHGLLRDRRPCLDPRDRPRRPGTRRRSSRRRPRLLPLRPRHAATYAKWSNASNATGYHTRVRRASVASPTPKWNTSARPRRLRWHRPPGQRCWPSGRIGDPQDGDAVIATAHKTDEHTTPPPTAT